MAQPRARPRSVISTRLPAASLIRLISGGPRPAPWVADRAVRRQCRGGLGGGRTMRAMAIYGLSAGLALAATAAAAEPDPAVLSYKLPDKIAWTGAPVRGPLTYTLWGDPTKPGPYAILVKWPPHQMSRPHTHPNARYV